MKILRYLIILGSVALFYQCKSTKSTSVQVAETEEKHELIVLDINFNSWLVLRPSIDMYSLSYLKTKNATFVAEYNNRVINRFNYSADLYPQRIEYSTTENYGKELEYTLYNYFIYFQEKYNQRL